MAAVRIGLNLLFLVPGETGGTETYARALIPELVELDSGHEFVAFINRETEQARGSLAWLERLPTVTVPVRSRERTQWVAGEQLLLPRLAAGRGLALVHSLANTAPLSGRFKRVTTIHDVHFKLVPEAHLGLLGLGMRVLVPLAARRSHAIITDANSTAGELCEHLGADRRKIDVIPLAVAQAGPQVAPAQDVRARFALGERPLVLSVSAKRPHKNLVRLITAVSLMPAERRPVVVIPGYPTAHEAELRAHAAQLGVAADVHLLSWIGPEELEGLYDAAACLVCPSLHEGFGLPVLEAMARGVPVVCSDRGALAEVAGDAAVFFDPLDPRAIATAIERVLGDEAEARRLVALGLQRAQEFSWQRTAQLTLATYERTLRS
jgi:glycosyltransferase involved in cell wall biosynthesis